MSESLTQSTSLLLDGTIQALLQRLNLTEFADVFEREHIDLTSVYLLSESDLEKVCISGSSGQTSVFSAPYGYLCVSCVCHV